MNLCARALRAGVFAGGRSVIPWDLVVQRVGGLLYLDVRDGCSLYDTTVCVCVRACVRALCARPCTMPHGTAPVTASRRPDGAVL